MKIIAKAFVIAASAFLMADTAQAQLVPTTSYEMWNGGYVDDTYVGTSGCAGCPYSQLSGGSGQLRDGAWKPSGENFFTDVYAWVGWTFNPSFIFNFAAGTDIGRVRFHVDNWNNAGVYSPSALIIGASNGTLGDMTGAMTYAVATPGSTNSYWIDIDVNAQGLNDITQLAVQLSRRGEWVFVDEVEFMAAADDVVPTPEPASMVLLATGLLGIGTVARRRRHS